MKKKKLSEDEDPIIYIKEPVDSDKDIFYPSDKIRSSREEIAAQLKRIADTLENIEKRL